MWNPIGESTNHFIVRITPFAAVVLNSKDKAPYFAYIEVLSTDDKNADPVPPKMLEASLIDETANINVEREVLSDEEEIYSGVERRDSSASDLDDSEAKNQPTNPDAVSLSRISIRSFDSHQSFETQSVVTAAEIR